MAKSRGKSKKAEVTVDYSALTDQQMQDLLEQALEQFCFKMEEAGCDPDFLTGVLFNQFTQRLAELNDREQFELILETALEESWEAQTIH